MALQNDEKSPILSRVSTRSHSFSAQASAETVIFLAIEETCFKHNCVTPGKTDGGWLGRFTPLTVIHSQSK